MQEGEEGGWNVQADDDEDIATRSRLVSIIKARVLHQGPCLHFVNTPGLVVPDQGGRPQAEAAQAAKDRVMTHEYTH